MSASFDSFQHVIHAAQVAVSLKGCTSVMVRAQPTSTGLTTLEQAIAIYVSNLLILYVLNLSLGSQLSEIEIAHLSSKSERIPVMLFA
jgi:hypothetical protein